MGTTGSRGSIEASRHESGLGFGRRFVWWRWGICESQVPMIITSHRLTIYVIGRKRWSRRLQAIKSQRSIELPPCTTSIAGMLRARIQRFVGRAFVERFLLQSFQHGGITRGHRAKVLCASRGAVWHWA